MITLEKEASKYGDKLTVAKRKGDVALIARDNGIRIAYEVVLIQVKKASVMFGRDYEARETMPSSSQWGSQGWTFVSEDLAEAKFKSLCIERGLIKPAPIRARRVAK